jgi:invasion protein IalB
VTERDGDSSARLQLFLPVGLYLAPGVKLTVDKGVAHRIPFTWCLTNTCIAGDLAKPALLRELEGGRNLGVEVIAVYIQDWCNRSPAIWREPSILDVVFCGSLVAWVFTSGD